MESDKTGKERRKEGRNKEGLKAVHKQPDQEVTCQMDFFSYQVRAHLV